MTDQSSPCLSLARRAARRWLVRHPPGSYDVPIALHSTLNCSVYTTAFLSGKLPTFHQLIEHTINICGGIHSSFLTDPFRDILHFIHYDVHQITKRLSEWKLTVTDATTASCSVVYCNWAFRTVFYCRIVCHYTTYEQKHVYMMSQKTVFLTWSSTDVNIRQR